MAGLAGPAFSLTQGEVMFVLNASAVFSRTASEIVQSVTVMVGRLAAQLADARNTRAAELSLWQDELRKLSTEVDDPANDLPRMITVEDLQAGVDGEELYGWQMSALDTLGRAVADAHDLCVVLEEQSTFWRAVEQECVRDPGMVCGLRADQLEWLGLLGG
jgi:hypothetical protein